MMRGQISNFHQVGKDRGERGIAHAALKKNGKKPVTKQEGRISNFHQVGEDRGERGIAHAAVKKNGKKTATKQEGAYFKLLPSWGRQRGKRDCIT